jgi:hypothetical protein
MRQQGQKSLKLFDVSHTELTVEFNKTTRQVYTVQLRGTFLAGVIKDRLK